MWCGRPALWITPSKPKSKPKKEKALPQGKPCGGFVRLGGAPGAGMQQKPERDRERTAQMGENPAKHRGGAKPRNMKTDPGAGSNRRGGHVGGRGSNLSAPVVILQRGRRDRRPPAAGMRRGHWQRRGWAARWRADQLGAPPAAVKLCGGAAGGGDAGDARVLPQQAGDIIGDGMPPDGAVRRR